MNKKNKFFSTTLATLVGAAIWIPSAQADFIPYTLDIYLGKARPKNSGAATELAAMKVAAGIDNLVLDFKVEEKDITAYENGAGSGQWYLDVGLDTPGYFLLKFGTGKGNDKDNTPNTFFFKNTGEMTKLVWSDAQVGFLSGGSDSIKGNIGKLSHYTTYDPTFHQTGEIPEPATLALVGLGLFAIGAIRRRKS